MCDMRFVCWSQVIWHHMAGRFSIKIAQLEIHFIPRSQSGCVAFEQKSTLIYDFGNVDDILMFAKETKAALNELQKP